MRRTDHRQTPALNQERRRRVAFEAARLMATTGLADYHQAKIKAAQRLGISDEAALPRNSEIEEQLREYQRLFQNADQPRELHRRREAALKAMTFFERFEPRLVGSVLDGSADGHTAVCLHLYDDDADAVARFLIDADIPAQARTRRLRLDRERDGDFPEWCFSADGVAFEITVLPTTLLRQAPLSPVDGKPMRRASMTTLRDLLADGTL
ncbi:MAG TPA: hypothetical protein VKM35_12415 [Arenimonas sp.]|uniref:hypothetical protein n=1 Tax=Arenimonas sp. TaxID=1872635 RepID=UPI002C6F9046|nr:hypothetical protein [Arenimonas sp.]HMB57995.1 hypothetical protein [Arenimonas sp.]